MNQETPNVEGEEIFGFRLEEGQQIQVRVLDGEETFNIGGEAAPGYYSLVKNATEKTNKEEA